LSRLRRALTFENVLVTAVAFMILAGGTAFAASQLGKNSVGSKQLKKNSVTTAKIKKNAVTAAKIKKGAVTGAKVKDGSLQAADFDLESVPYAHIVHTSTLGAPVQLGSEVVNPVVLSLSNPTYTQPTGRDDIYSGRLDVTFSDSCTAPRVAVAFLTLDGTPATLEDQNTIAAYGYLILESGGPGTFHLNLGTALGSGVGLQSSAPIPHTLSMNVLGGCAGGTATVTAAQASVQGVGS
jgi:hypothetical protein